MDIQHLLDRLEEAINTGRHVPFMSSTMVDEQRLLEIIDQMRISIPDEIEKAKRVLRERDRIIAQANEEAARIRELAREKSETLVQRDAITQAAQARAASIVEQSRNEADVIRAEADQYVVDVLSDLEDALMRTLGVVRNGITHVQREQQKRPVPIQVNADTDLQPTMLESEPRQIERISARRD
jgi:cell division septum initiation protein DivIVA